MKYNTHGQEMEMLLAFSMMLREHLLSSLTVVFFCLFLCFPVFQSSAPTTKRAQSEQQ